MMTREEAYKKLCKLPVGHTMDYIALVPAKNLIDEIFDQQDKLEAKIKTKDERIEAQSSVIIACQNAILQKDERIEELEAMVEKMKCGENCNFYPPQKCSFNTQYGCLDGLIPNTAMRGNGGRNISQFCLKSCVDHV